MNLRQAALAFSLALSVLSSSASSAAAPSDTTFVVGGVTLAATGYFCGVLPALSPHNSAAVYLPIVGPAVWWLAADQRIAERVRYEREHPCEGTGEPFSCFGEDTADLDHAAHVLIGLPYAALATGTQLVGVAFLIHGTSSKRRSERNVTVVPSASGATVVGRF